VLALERDFRRDPLVDAARGHGASPEKR
jgi:hypothetical protein